MSITADTSTRSAESPSSKNALCCPWCEICRAQATEHIHIHILLLATLTAMIDAAGRWHHIVVEMQASVVAPMEVPYGACFTSSTATTHTADKTPNTEQLLLLLPLLILRPL